MNPNRILFRSMLMALFAIGLCAASADASMQTLNFSNITANDVADATTGESQLSVTISDEYPGLTVPGQVAFTFTNTGAAAMSITDVYFDDGSLLGISSIVNGSGVSFSPGASPGNLPGGNAIDFNTSAGFLADSDTPKLQLNGVNPGESLTIIFNLIDGQTYADVIAAIDLSSEADNWGVDVEGGLRIGIHVQGFDGGGSESFVNNGGGFDLGGDPDPVPEPASIILFGLGTLGMGALARRRRQSEEPELA